MFSPQPVPQETPRATRPRDRQVVEWTDGDPLPWQTLAPPLVAKKTGVWQHTVYLGVYQLDATYERLHLAFGQDTDAYDARPVGRSACAAVVVDGHGALLAPSAMLSSALWAVAQIGAHGVDDPGWVDGFSGAVKRFRTDIDVQEGARRDRVGGDAPPAQDARSLRALVHAAHDAAGIVGLDGLATGSIVIRSVAMSPQRADEVGDSDFLNSFFLDDLATVGERAKDHLLPTTALAQYLTGADSLDIARRTDVMVDDETVNRGVGADRLPKGRWPSDPAHPLSLRQQLAVNRALGDLGSVRGLMGVNGPPGTGKTTMLRDVLAGNVVERARSLARLARPEDAFTATTHGWTAATGHLRRVRQLRPDLTGFEMVLASPNNAAAENVTTEIPLISAIHPRWQAEADYFADIATAVLAETGDKRDGGVAPGRAWGMVAARLGNKKNRNSFHSAFWFDQKDPQPDHPDPPAGRRMKAQLARWRDGSDPVTSWAQARAEFARAEERVDRLIDERRRAEGRLRQLPVMIEDERRRAAATDDLLARSRAATRRLEQARAGLGRARGECDEAAAARDRHLGVRPGVVESILSLGRTARQWRAALRLIDDEQHTAQSAQRRADAQVCDLDEQRQQLLRAVAAARVDRSEAAQRLSSLRRQIGVDAAERPGAYPDQTWTGHVRELRAPWLDPELDAARSELFLAALRLHRDFVANAAVTMESGLRAALDVVSGQCPRGLEPAKRRAAWQLFFLVVPLVSTTFHSFGPLFGDIGPESIGWLLIDEAGQASPQHAASAIWRARRVLAVGDPLQLPPVVTIPLKAQRDIAAAYDVDETWLPPLASVQTLTDRVSHLGTHLRQADQRVWVSAPLTVHRRCDDPMFTLCNEIAYNGIMVHAVGRPEHSLDHGDPFDGNPGVRIAASHWADEPAPTRGSHLQINQVARLERALSYLASHGVPCHEVIAISPFREVADRLSALAHAYPGLRAGTIHTAQGREASVVVLVLGGDPGSPGAKAWAASSVNLVNVAASRARRRLYVIGDRASWSHHNYFSQLAAALAPKADSHALPDWIQSSRGRGHLPG